MRHSAKKLNSWVVLINAGAACQALETTLYQTNWSSNNGARLGKGTKKGGLHAHLFRIGQATHYRDNTRLKSIKRRRIPACPGLGVGRKVLRYRKAAKWM
jgi:hypothetical protein